MRDPAWIFFDCFNTLVDDFDASGDESGLGPVAPIAVRSGFYATEAAFRSAYEMWHRKRWSGADWTESRLDERLRAVLSDRAPDRGDDVGRCVEEMVAAYRRECWSELRPTPGALDMLDAWRGRARLGVVSNVFLPGWPGVVLERFGLRAYFDFVVDSAEIGFKKPDPRIYRAALERARVPAADVLFVGDRLPGDVYAPLRLGMRAIHLDRSADRPLPPAPHDVVSIRSWDEFRPS